MEALIDLPAGIDVRPFITYEDNYLITVIRIAKDIYCSKGPERILCQLHLYVAVHLFDP